jgi:hypothetical protein
MAAAPATPPDSPPDSRNGQLSVVISQPMFFPWVGMFEQIRLADVYVHYGDVQFSKGSFENRVQVKTPQGIKWLTVPLEGRALEQSIEEVRINSRIDWRDQHLGMLRGAYARAPHFGQMMELVNSVYSRTWLTIGELSRASIDAVCAYFGLTEGRRFVDIRELGIAGSSSQRVVDIVKALGGRRYITGWGARNYLQHQLFEDADIRVEYMDYQKLPYPQLHGGFTPYVSVLDLIANVGREGGNYIRSGSSYWKQWMERNG